MLRLTTRTKYNKLKKKVPETHTTVLDLKRAIKRNYELNQRRLANRMQRSSDNNDKPLKKRHRHSSSDVDGHRTTRISWRYIWRKYYLEYDGEPLSDDRQLLKDYGIRNKSSLKFVDKVKLLNRSRSGKKRRV